MLNSAYRFGSEIGKVSQVAKRWKRIRPGRSQTACIYLHYWWSWQFWGFCKEYPLASGRSEERLILPTPARRKNYFGEILGWIYRSHFSLYSGCSWWEGWPEWQWWRRWNIQRRKIKAQIFDKDTNVKINFNDVAGLEESKDWGNGDCRLSQESEEIYPAWWKDS